MSIQNTLHLSKLSNEEIKKVYKQWPKITLLASLMIVGTIVMVYGMQATNKSLENLNTLLWSFAVFVPLTLGSSIFGLLQVSKAKKALNIFAEKYSLPSEELLREFKLNLKNMKPL